ncbi:STAS domain-containing protein [Amycolatopsis magusensis]|uniref:Anti-sigma factor antagonist n=1 Tax=Amycolatopsis magusensis TaxID=882444 RepID=A0ABS4PQP5_9PSEU|nr:STAS domain-containing protein [Amycolatopsis magusensis]MBP2181735.1 anti-anti-sigma factor [Amycolatopsis magusensis]MDI5981089.1 STAS domain-containing protein [Amycolatopsis magusensis]
MPYLPARAGMTVSTTAEATVVAVSGEIDALIVQRLRDQLTTEILLRPRAVVVDLTTVTFCSSEGLSALVGACGDAHAAGIPFTVATQQHAVLRPIELLSLHKLLVVRPTVDEALAWAARPLTASG